MRPGSDRQVHVVLPNDIDDPAVPSGGNGYDRRVCRGLAAVGWVVHEHPAYGAWPVPTASERDALGRVLDGLPDGALVLADGLVASAARDVLVPRAARLRLVVLVHMPLGGAAEGEVLAAARAVVATSDVTRRQLLDAYRLAPDQVDTAQPGVEPAPLAAESEPGGRLLCVAAVTPNKGHDLLVEALAKVADAPWTCTCVGSLDRDPEFVARLRRQVTTSGLGGRVLLAGARTGAGLDAGYAAADLLVLASHGETYGMVVTEALARG
ncbi:MAG TPA: glycosyltransferase, partial [Rugosimonospora sp.]|nr:glycosyltransferase [Rugosimonospora sp.]